LLLIGWVIASTLIELRRINMASRGFTRLISQTFSVLSLLLANCVTASAAPIFWTDWLGADTDPGPGFRGQGAITTSTSSVNVTYTNPRGIGFYQPSGGTDYWTPRTPVSNSPYTSALVDNPPTGTDIVALQFAGNQTLSFSQAIANPVFSYVSLNGNGYAFLNQDFNILSFGAGLGAAAPGDNSCGFWGCGTSSKRVVDLGGGNVEYQLVGTGEPHGTIQFTGAFDTLTWRSLSNEFWNGFTVGVQGTAAEILPPGTVPVPVPGTLPETGPGTVSAAVPEPSTWFLLATGFVGLLVFSRGRPQRAA
jgi:hypothetical protein